MTKYLIILILALAGFGFFSIKSCQKRGDEVEALQKDTAKLNLKVDFYKNHINLIQTAATEKTVEYENKIGFMSKEYQTDLTKFKLMLLKLQNKAIDTTIVIKESDLLETIIDTVETHDLALYYRIEVLGMLKSIFFDYKVTEKTIIEKKIIYENIYVDKPIKIWMPKRHLYTFASYGVKNSSIDINLMYITKKKISFIIGWEHLFIEQKNYSNAKIGVGFRLF